MQPGYIHRHGQLLPYMNIEIKAFVVPPAMSDYLYWDEISNLISTNSLCGLNDIVPCLRSQKMKIPEDLSKITYNTFDKKVNIVISNLTIDSNARYWEKSLIDTLVKYSVKKYGDLVDPTSEFIHIIERQLKVSTHNSWKEQASNLVMVRDKGDAKSLVSVGKIKLKGAYVNEYTALYMVLKYKATIKLKNDETEEFIMLLAYTLIMPDFYNGEYINCSFNEVMTMGPEKTINFESLWIPEEMHAVGKENPVLKVRFTISGDIKFKPIKESEYDRGIDKKIKSIYSELDTSQAEMDELRKTQEMKFTRTKNLKEQLEIEYKTLSSSKISLGKKKLDLEEKLTKIKKLLNEDEAELKMEYDSKEKVVIDRISKLEREVKDYRDMCGRVIDLCRDRARKNLSKSKEKVKST